MVGAVLFDRSEVSLSVVLELAAFFVVASGHEDVLYDPMATLIQ
jgi:hypothetical protein